MKIDLAAADRVVERYRQQMVDEEAKVARDLKQAIATKTALADHYWQEAHRARMYHATALAVRAALEEL